MNNYKIMRKKYLNILKVTLILFPYNSQAFAYLDPGTGGLALRVDISDSVVWQQLPSTLELHITYIKSFFQKIKKIF